VVALEIALSIEYSLDKSQSLEIKSNKRERENEV
jgi:hypothetical protein